MSTTSNVTAEEARQHLAEMARRAKVSQRRLAGCLTAVLGRPVSQPTVCAWIGGKTAIPQHHRELLRQTAERRRREPAWYCMFMVLRGEL